MSTPIADQSMFWLCTHGHRSLRHHENCDECGEARPAPEPDTEPSDLSRPDVSDVSGLSIEIKRLRNDLRIANETIALVAMQRDSWMREMKRLHPGLYQE